VKIRVIVNTYRKPRQALAVIEVARNMASGNHEIEYILAYDNEDMESVEFFHRHGLGYPHIWWDQKPRPRTTPDCWNRSMVPGTAEIYVPLPDDGWIACPNWDEALVEFYYSYPDKRLFVTGWIDQANPSQLTNVIISDGWLRLLEGEPVYDNRFPFWFCDTAINELYAFIHGSGVPILQIMALAGKPFQPHPGLRDMDIWWDLFGATRIERLATAARIRKACNKPEPSNLAKIVADCEDRDGRGRLDGHEIIRQMEEKGPLPEPAQHYLDAKAAALEYLKGIEQKLDFSKGVGFVQYG